MVELLDGDGNGDWVDGDMLLPDDAGASFVGDEARGNEGGLKADLGMGYSRSHCRISASLEAADWPESINKTLRWHGALSSLRRYMCLPAKLSP